MLNKRYNTRKMGILLLVAGCLTALYCMASYSLAAYENQFFDIYSDSPSPRHGAFRCPLVMSLTERGQISVLVNNPSDYSINVNAPGLTVEPAGAGTWTIPPGQIGNHTVHFMAYSHEDLAKPGVSGAGGTMWQVYSSSSFTDECFISITPLPLPFTPMILLSIASIVLGTALVVYSLPTAARIKRQGTNNLKT